MRTRFQALGLAITAFSLMACRREEIVVRTEDRAVPQESASARALRWSAPQGWTEVPGAGMRAASFRLLPPADKAEVIVVTLPGDVGGELANVNRWRGQIGLTPVSPDALALLRQPVSSPAGPVTLYDFRAVGDGAQETKIRLVVGVLQFNGASWFFKLMGPGASVAAARPAFVELLQSLRRDEI